MKRLWTGLFTFTAMMNGALRGSPTERGRGKTRVGAHLVSDGTLDKVYLSACLGERVLPAPPLLTTGSLK